MKYKSNRYLLNPLGCFLGILFVLSMVTSCNNDDESSDGSGSSSDPEISSSIQNYWHLLNLTNVSVALEPRIMDQLQTPPQATAPI